MPEPQPINGGITWMQATLHPDNYVIFTNNILEPETTSLHYEKFCRYVLRTFRIQQTNEFIEALNTFQPILIDCESGNWKVITVEDIRASRPAYTFDELYALNGDSKQQAAAQRSTDYLPQSQHYQSQIDRTYGYFAKLLGGKRSNVPDRTK